jgi:hypothetical protein
MIRMVIYALEGLGKAIKFTIDKIVGFFKFASWLISAIGHYVILMPWAWILGLGNVEKGFQRLHKFFSFLGSFFAFFLTISLGRWLWGRTIEGLLSVLRIIRKFLFGFSLFGKDIPGAFTLIVKAVKTAFNNMAAVFRLIRNLFNMWRTLTPTMGPIRAFIRVVTSIFSLLKNWIIKEFIEPLKQKLWALFIQYVVPVISAIGGLIKAGWKYLMQLLFERKVKERNATQGLVSAGLGLFSNILGGIGGIAGGLGGMAGGLGGLGMLGGLGGALGAALPGLWWILPLLAILGGAGYGIYRLVTRPSAAPATTYQPVPPAAAAPAYATMSVNIAPTIIVPQGTTAEQAQAIMAELEPQIVALFKRLNWHEELNTMEKNMRAGLTAGVV